MTMTYFFYSRKLLDTYRNNESVGKIRQQTRRVLARTHKVKLLRTVFQFYRVRLIFCGEFYLFRTSLEKLSWLKSHFWPHSL